MLRKPLIQLGLVTAAMSIVLTLATPLTAAAARGELCLELFGGIPAYKRANYTARLDAASYPMTNGRGINEYEITLLPKGHKITDYLPRGGVIVDVGGGRGVAMGELAKKADVDTVVINTQDFTELHRGSRLKGSLEFRAGWAEQELRKIPTGSVDVVVDLWGGFAYSPNKVEILEEIYRVLKPGGRAFVLHPSKTPATIEDARVNYGQPVSVGLYLAKRFPSTFAEKRPHHPDLQAGRVIEIAKPASGEPATLDLSLESTEVKQMPRIGPYQSAFVSVVYSLKN